ncbi:hypothetical protein ACGLHS_09705 [Variovorax sp. VaC1]|uniref:hypothetical protein n=1 Tax=Variovorax sp. VaC1 TaxID=3373132 RepID=UPI0037484881
MFALAHRRETLRRALHAALAQRRPQALQALLYSHGAAAFAATLSPCSGRVIADALSTLPAPQRNEVFRHLTRAARRRCAQVGGRAFDARLSMGFFARLLAFCLPLRGARL